MRRFLSKIQRGRSHSDNVFEEQLIYNLDSLYAFALRLTRNQDDAEDLVQEASLSAFRFFDRLKDKRSFKSWIFKIARTLYFNRRRSSKEFEPLEDLPAADFAQDGATLVIDRILASEIREALDALPLEFRTAVWLSDVQGFSHREIAQILDCPVGTVGSRLHRGRALLLRELNTPEQRKEREEQS